MPTVIRVAKMFGCSCVIAHILVRQFEQTGISIDAQGHIRKQLQDKTVNLHSNIDVGVSSKQL